MVIIAQYWWSGRHLDEEVPTRRGVQFRGEVYGPGSDGRSSWGLGWVTWGGAGAPGGCKNVFRSISGDTGGVGGVCGGSGKHTGTETGDRKKKQYQ